jgi:hypothetical protein
VRSNTICYASTMNTNGRVKSALNATHFSRFMTNGKITFSSLAMEN